MDYRERNSTQPYPPRCPPSGNGGQIGDIRERLARLETAARYQADRVEAHARRFDSSEDRFSNIATRVTGLSDLTTQHTRELGTLADTTKRLEAIETKARIAKDLIQYAAGGLILSLALAGKISMSDALGLFAKAFGIG